MLTFYDSYATITPNGMAHECPWHAPRKRITLSLPLDL